MIVWVVLTMLGFLLIGGAGFMAGRKQTVNESRAFKDGAASRDAEVRAVASQVLTLQTQVGFMALLLADLGVPIKDLFLSPVAGSPAWAIGFPQRCKVGLPALCRACGWQVKTFDAMGAPMETIRSVTAIRGYWTDNDLDGRFFLTTENGLNPQFLLATT